MIHERIKQIRSTYRLTQQQFADRLGITRNTIATYETGKSNPSDAAVALICGKFNVNETWLRTGEGDMFIRSSVEGDIAKLISQAKSGPDASFKRKLLSILAGLSEEQWELLADIAERLASPKTDEEEPDEEEPGEESIDAKVEEYRRALEEEKKKRRENQKHPDLSDQEEVITKPGVHPWDQEEAAVRPEAYIHGIKRK